VRCCGCAPPPPPAHRFEFLAGDDVFLGAAAKVYAAEGSSWRRSYYLPTSADLAITKMRQWMVSDLASSVSMVHLEQQSGWPQGVCTVGSRVVSCTEQCVAGMRVLLADTSCRREAWSNNALLGCKCACGPLRLQVCLLVPKPVLRGGSSSYGEICADLLLS
jgi:hypothetical protein